MDDMLLNQTRNCMLHCCTVWYIRYPTIYIRLYFIGNTALFNEIFGLGGEKTHHSPVKNALPQKSVLSTVWEILVHPHPHPLPPPSTTNHPPRQTATRANYYHRTKIYRIKAAPFLSFSFFHISLFLSIFLSLFASRSGMTRSH